MPGPFFNTDYCYSLRVDDGGQSVSETAERGSMKLRSICWASITAAALVSGGGSHGVLAQDVAQDEQADVIADGFAQQNASAEALGNRMHAFDQAAWHATDALAASIELSSVKQPRGYVVLPREGDTMLDTVFVVEREGALREFARFTVDGSTVVAGGLIEGDLPQLSDKAERMLNARGPAIEAMGEAGYGLCSESSPNTLTLPPDKDGTIAFFLLTSTLDARYYPIGGHYRADIAADGQVANTRRYMNTCLDMPVQLPPSGGSVGRPAVSYLLGDSPSEIHVFASHQFPNGLFVITSSNNKLWLIENGKIVLKESNFKPE